MIGIFLGSFDPPHIGHLSVVSECLNNGVSSVIVVPAYKNPWKPEQTPYDIRFKMTQAAFSMYRNKVWVSNAEFLLHRDKEKRELYYNPEDIDKPGIPTYALLRFIRDIGGKTDMRLVVTSETFFEISKWIQGNEVYRENQFIVLFPEHMGRTEIKTTERITEIHPKVDIQVSSTMIRERIGKDLIVNEFLPGNVNALIYEHKLYTR
jgi:nicotinate-nucleotide adenylyltransferase